MCAIAGVIQKEDMDNIATVRNMCKRMVRRGPDYQDVFYENKVTLGHCRLSILDLSTGNQPMSSADKKIVIVFNGEIYNFLEIKKELNDYQFTTKSDTEVIIAGYQKWGIKGILNRLEGMFAFSIYDRVTKSVYIARDKYGEKPLYYKKTDNSFSFASELKAFNPDLKHYSLDLEGLNYFLALSYIPAPHTIFREFRKLEQGHYLEITEDFQIVDIAYYNLADRIAEPCDDSYKEAKNKIKEMMYDSVKKRMIADVPTGAFLSGGIDSSIVCGIMQEINDTPFHTFSIGFPNKEYDESKRAQLVADRIKSKHHLLILNYSDVVDNISDIIDYYDEPFSDSSALPSYCVAKLAHNDVKVVLTGDAADEIFAGYDKYLGRYYAQKFNNLPRIMQKSIETFAKYCPLTKHSNAILRKIKKLLNTAKASDFDIYYNLMCLGFPDFKRIALLKPSYYYDIRPNIKNTYDSCPSNNPLNKEQFCDFKYVLEGDMFPKVDRACMHNSLENRTPILDSKIVEYLFKINPEYKLKGRNKKRILKETFNQILPKKTIHFKKRGFSVPIDYWFRNELKEEMSQLIKKEFIEKQGIFNYSYVKELFDKHMSGEANNMAQLWSIFVFQKWYNKKNQGL